MKKEIIKKSVKLIVLVGLLIWYANLNATEKVTRNYEMKKDNQISIMVYDEETEDYVAQDTVPTGYTLDKEKTYCVNGGEITSYDSTNGVINYNLNTDDKCYIYLKIPEPITFWVDVVYRCEGDSDYSEYYSQQFSIMEGSTFLNVVEQYDNDFQDAGSAGIIYKGYGFLLKESRGNVIAVMAEDIVENIRYIVDFSGGVC